MQLFRIDVYEDFPSKNIKKILDIIHYNAVECFKVPSRDRYQIITRHKSDEIIFEDTGLGFERTKNIISIQIFSRKRKKEMKLDFYKKVVEDLNKELNINRTDIMFSFFENSDEDWSFANGEAQFIIGELK